MRKVVIQGLAVAFALISCLSLQGCSYQVQLSQRLLIQGIGIDYEDGVYRATVQVTKVSDQEENTVSLMNGEGDSAMDALNAITLANGKKPLYSHSLVLVLGRGCAEEGLSNVMDFFIRYPESHPTVNVLMADSSAEDILSTEQEDGKYIQARDIAELAKGGKYNGDRDVGCDQPAARRRVFPLSSHCDAGWRIDRIQWHGGLFRRSAGS